MGLADMNHRLEYQNKHSGNLDQATELLQRAIEIRENLGAELTLDTFGKSKSPMNIGSLAKYYVHLADVYRDRTKHDQARRLYEQSVDLINDIPEQHRANPNVANVYFAMAFYRLKRWQEAQHVLELGLRGLQKPDPTTAKSWYLAMTLHQLGEHEKARSYYGQLAEQLLHTPTDSVVINSLKTEAAMLLGITQD